MRKKTDLGTLDVATLVHRVATREIQSVRKYWSVAMTHPLTPNQLLLIVQQCRNGAVRDEAALDLLASADASQETFRAAADADLSLYIRNMLLRRCLQAA